MDEGREDRLRNGNRWENSAGGDSALKSLWDEEFNPGSECRNRRPGMSCAMARP